MIKDRAYRIAIIADIGHSSPRIPGISEEMAKLGVDIDVFTPKLSRKQKKAFLINLKFNWNLVESRRFPMLYKRHINLPKLFRLVFKIYWLLIFKIRFFTLHSEHKDVQNLSLEHTGWSKFLEKDFLKKEKIKNYDLIFSTSSPFECHFIGHYLAKKYNKVWIADYRDLFSDNYVSKRYTHLRIHEKKIISSASALTTVSKDLARRLKVLHSKEVYVLYNGFQKLGPKRSITIKDKINILYTGTISNGFQNYKLILEALKILNENEIKAEISFAGSSNSDITEFYETSGTEIPKWIHLLGHLSRNQSLKLQQEFDLLLYLHWEDRNTTGVLLTKFYEYLASGTPVISIGGYDTDELVLMMNELGMNMPLKKIDEILVFLENLYVEKKIQACRNDSKAESFSYKIIANNFDTFIRTILKTSK
jgi:glycosyltransferase involved in cell wall biosynthesis